MPKEGIEYLVNWAHYSDALSTWVIASMLDYLQKLAGFLGHEESKSELSSSIFFPFLNKRFC
jgi:hypothetical protein